MIFKSKGIELVELQEKDFPTLFSWRNSEDFMALCSTRRNSVTFQEFRTELLKDFKKDRFEQFMILLREREVGTIYSYSMNLTDRHCFFTIYLTKECRDFGYGALAVAVYIRSLLQRYGLYKIYADVYSYNEKSLYALLSGGFVEEGRLHGHRLLNGNRYDLIRLAYFVTEDSEKQIMRILPY